MSETIILTILTILCWGGWGIFAKMAIAKTGWPTAFALSYLISTLATFAILSSKIQFKVGFQNILIIALSSLAVCLGSVFFYLLLSKKQASAVVPLTSLYPVVTILIAVIFLGESLTIKQIIGAVFALVALFLISI